LASGAPEVLVDAKTVKDDHPDRLEGATADLPTLVASLNAQTGFALLALAVQLFTIFFVGSVELLLQE